MTEWMEDYPEPKVKTKFVTMRQIKEIWDGEKWIHFSTLYYPTHPGKIRQEIIKECEAKISTTQALAATALGEWSQK